MAKWTKNKVNPEQINNGNEYNVNDNLSVESINAIINNSFKAQEDSEEALKKANSAYEANGTLVKINGENQTEWDATFSQKLYDESKNILGQDSLIREKSYYNGKFVPHEDANVFMVEVEPNTKYIFSDNGIPMKISYVAFWDENNKIIGNVSYDKLSITTPVNAKYFVLSIWKKSVEGIQIERGDVITSYQPYNHNRHITNPQADFLKSECDKSANKLYAEDVLITADKGLTCKYVRSTNELEVTGTATENITNHGFNIPLIEKIPSGKNIYFGYEGNGGEVDAYNLFLCASNGWEGTGGANLSYNNPLTHYTSIREANYVRFYLWNLSQGQSINVKIKLFVNYDYHLGYSEWNGEHLTEKDIKPVLLWENGNIGQFNAQQVTINGTFTEGKKYRLLWRFGAKWKTMQTDFIFQTGDGSGVDISYFRNVNTSFNGATRQFTPSVNKITFADAYYFSGSTTGNVLNTQMIPIALYELPY